MRLLRLIAAVLELALVAWSAYQLFALVLEAWRSVTEPAGPTYPNTYGIRLEPLTPAERDAAIDGELALARRLAELGADRVGSALPAAADSTPPAAGKQPRAVSGS